MRIRGSQARLEIICAALSLLIIGSLTTLVIVLDKII